MSSIYENLEPNDLTTLFPQLSENQLSSIGGGGNGNGEGTGNGSVEYNSLSKVRTLHFYNGSIEQNLKSGTRYTYPVTENRYSEQRDYNGMIQVQSIVGAKYQVLLYITDDTLASTYDYLEYHIFSSSGAGLGTIKIYNKVLTDIDVPSDGKVSFIQNMIFKNYTKNNVTYSLNDIGVWNLFLIIPVS